ncbi:MAG TPA: ketol-acid reductoisomerase, partial [Acidimicrobiia bacterium]|nr:ketol-acid reductoisomerase [Acidimicrobiia bacterium]
LTRRDRYDGIDVLSTMRALVGDIDTGRFADEWDAERDAGYPVLHDLKARFAGPEVRAFEDDLRRQLGPRSLNR